MTQTVVDISHLKDYDTAHALDALGTTLANIATGASGVNNVVLTGSATSVKPTISVGGASADANIALQVKGNGTGGVQVQGATNGTAVTAGYMGEVMGDKLFGPATTATVTLTQAAPGVITWTSHGFSTTIPQPVVFTTTGALPDNITAGTVYYTAPSTVTADTFSISTSVANALAGTLIDTTAGSNTGTQTGTAGVALANTTAIDVSGIALTAGVWRVWGEIIWTLNAATTWTTLESSISQTSATLATSGTVRGTSYLLQAQISAAATNGTTSASIPACYVNISATTNVFLVVKAAFATNTAKASGFIFAQRIA